MEFTEPSLILKVGRFREADLWVRLATPERGVFSAFAFGGSRSRRRFLGCLDPFNRVLFHFQTSHRGEYTYLMEGSLEQGRPELRSDPRRLGLAVNCVKFFESVYEGPTGARQAFDLLSGALDLMEGRSDVSSLFPVLFRAKVVFTQGYGPELSTCPHCGKDLKASVAPTLLVEEGLVACSEHCQGYGRRVVLDAETVELLETVRQRSPRHWCTAAPSRSSRRRLYEAVDGLVRYHLGLAWEDGRFQRI